MDGLNEEVKLETQRDIFQRVQDDLQDDGLDKVHITYVSTFHSFSLFFPTGVVVYSARFKYHSAECRWFDTLCRENQSLFDVSMRVRCYCI